MRFARGLYDRFRHLIHEMTKFGIVGVMGTIITFGGTGLLDKKAGLGIVLGSTIATIVATFASYLGNRYWTFRDRQRTGMTRETVVFFVLNGIGLAIQEAVVLICRDALGLRGTIADYIALCIGVAVAMVFRFWSYRKWVWRAVLAGGSPAGLPPVDRETLEPAEQLSSAIVPPSARPRAPAGGRGRHAAGRFR